MIIGLSGKSCSGKSTTLEYLRKDMPWCGFITEVARDVVLREGINLKELILCEQGYYLFQKLLLEEYCRRVDELRRDKLVIISDRTIYDIAVYSRIYLSDKYFNKIKNRIMRCRDYQPFNLIYFEPLDFVDDGVRIPVAQDVELQLFEVAVKPQADLVVNYRKDTYSDVLHYIKNVIDEHTI